MQKSLVNVVTTFVEHLLRSPKMSVQNGFLPTRSFRIIVHLNTMRQYEFILHALTALKSLSVLGLDVVLSLGLVFVLYKHLKVEKITWRSYSLYALILLNFVLLAGLDLIFPNWNSRWLTIVMLTLTVASALIHWIYPIPSLPKLTQPIGTKIIKWTTTVQYSNIRGDRETQEREIHGRFWYPAETIEGYNKKSYYGPLENSKHVEWYYQNIKHFILTDVNARYDAPLSNMKAKYPVILFTHGQESLPENHTYVLEKLASKGFIVLGLYHNDLNGKYPGPLSYRMMELAATVKQLVAMNNAANDFFSNRLDFTHGIGLHGHSLGGATSFFASTDFESLSQRYLSDLPVPLTCCSCSDPWMWIVLKDNYDVTRPLLMVKSDHWLGRDDDLDKIHHFSRKRLRAPVAVVTMKNTWHYNFGDMVFKLMSPLGLKVYPRSWRCEGNLTTPMLGEHGQRGVNTLNHVIQFVEEFHTHHLVDGSVAPFQPSNALMTSDTCSVELNLPKK